MENIITKIIEKIKIKFINKNNLPQNYVLEEMPPILTTTTPEENITEEEMNIDSLLEEDYSDNIEKFIEVLTTHFSPEDLTRFYNNMDSIDIKIISKKRFQQVSQNQPNTKKNLGEYYPTCNSMLLVEEDYNKVIYHKLFHVASSNFDMENRVSFLGFSQSRLEGGTNVGEPLNEGYTELMTNRYFFPSTESKYYKYEVRVASQIEEIVGQEKMEKLYLNANLYGLIKELEKYASSDNIKIFLDNLEYVYSNYNKSELHHSVRRNIYNIIEEIETFLYETKLNKIYITNQSLHTKEEYMQEFLTQKDTISKIVIEKPNGTYIIDYDKITAVVLEKYKNSLLLANAPVLKLSKN